MSDTHNKMNHAEIEVRDLRLVSAISSKGTTTAAARVLGVSQSAVSHQLRNLEERLEQDVFVREGRRLVLSEAGQRLLDFAEQMLPEFETLGRDLVHEANAPKQQLRVATECFTAYHWFPRASGGLLRKFPQVELKIVAEATVDPRTALEQKRIDLAFCIEPHQEGTFLRKKAFSDEMVLVTSPRHPLAARDWVKGEDLLLEHLILYDNRAARKSPIRYVLFPNGERPKAITRLPLTEAICEMVRAEMGVAILPDWSVASYLRRGELSCTRLTRRGIKRHWVGLYHQDSALAPAVRALLDLIEEQGATAGG